MKQIIKKIFSSTLGLKTSSDFLQIATRERNQDEDVIPATVLNEKHIRNLEMLVSREAMLDRFPKGGICAEIGVNEGEFSQKIYAHTLPAELHLIDAWAEARYHDGLRVGVETIFKNEIANKKVFLHHGYSTEIIPGFNNEYFDWVYLDTGHDYRLTIQELNLLKPVMKPGGIIAGHDYVMGNWVKGIRYGVMEAVHEFCARENWEIIYLTINLPESPSFAIRAIVS